MAPAPVQSWSLCRISKDWASFSDGEAMYIVPALAYCVVRSLAYRAGRVLAYCVVSFLAYSVEVARLDVWRSA